MTPRAPKPSGRPKKGKVYKCASYQKLHQKVASLEATILEKDKTIAAQAEEINSITGSSRQMATKTLSGSCACGSITYTSTAAPEHLDYCYCLTCQRMSGAPFMVWMGIPRDALHWDFKDSEPLVYRSTIGDSDDCVAERTCCGSCGCNVILQYHVYPDKTHIAASTMSRSDFESPKVGCHIWCRHVPSWHNLPDDGVKRYDEFDPDFKAHLEEYLSNKADEG
ncbi:hypothetical protein LTR37_000400 [Vermiconidia calcicola]|uniref:Uncharacterized protein n=1 Tax=Vermiconidia calcicola TaxID=1690605 RepID=A0ACC3NYR6_9PEZI|nr:hypothetical protein LTR37_000400 [Vermiconidia calcicola]